MRTFHRAIHQLFKNLAQSAVTSPDQPVCRMTRHTIETIHQFLLAFVKRVAELAHDARQIEETKTLLLRHVHYAANELGQSITIIEDALMEYDAKQGFLKHSRREDKAELTLPVSLCEKYLRKGRDAALDAHAIIATAAITESFCRSLLPTIEYLQVFESLYKRITIKTSDLLSQWYNGPACSVLVTLGIDHPSLLGYNPDLHGPITKRRSTRFQNDDMSLIDDIEIVESEVVDESEAVDESETAPTLGGHRKKKPGQLSRKYIRACQKNHHRLFRKLPLERLIRNMTETVACRSIRFKPEAIRDIQCWIEYRLLSFLQKTVTLCAHSKRQTCRGVDLMMVYNLTDHTSQDIPDPLLWVWDTTGSFHHGLRQLCYRAGIQRRSNSLLRSIHAIMIFELLALVTSMVHFMNSVHRNTVSHSLVQWSIRKC